MEILYISRGRNLGKPRSTLVFIEAEKVFKHTKKSTFKVQSLVCLKMHLTT